MGNYLKMADKQRIQACLLQAGHTALYRSAFDLVQDMAEAEATGTRKELINNLCKVDLSAAKQTCWYWKTWG